MRARRARRAQARVRTHRRVRDNVVSNIVQSRSRGSSRWYDVRRAHIDVLL